jgi:WD40 repeat protein
MQAVQQHRGAVYQLAYTPDGRLLFSGGCDGLLCVYDATRNYQPVKLLCAASMAVAAVGKTGPCCAAVSPDGQQLASSSYDEQQGGNCVLLLAPSSQKMRLCIVLGPASISR